VLPPLAKRVTVEPANYIPLLQHKPLPLPEYNAITYILERVSFYLLKIARTGKSVFQAACSLCSSPEDNGQ
jgi:hypothetical protein